MSTGFITQKRQERSKRKADRLSEEQAKRKLTVKLDDTKKPTGSFFFRISTGIAAAKRAAKKRKNIKARASKRS